MRLSVCIVTYNHEPYIEECIRSALMQKTDFDFEVVVGEDNSPDGTADVLRKLEAETNGQLRVIYRDQNLGAGENFEATLDTCRHKYVAFLEGDNFWTDPNKLQMQVDLLDRTPDMPFCFHRTTSLHTDDAHHQFVLPPEEMPASNGFGALMHQHNPVAFGSMVVRRELLADMPAWTRGLRLGDWPICMMLARHGAFGYIPKVMSRQRMHDAGSWSRLPSHQRTLYVLQMLFRVHGLLEGDLRLQMRQKLDETTGWLCREVVTGQVEDLRGLLDALDGMNEPGFVTYLVENLLSAANQLANEQHPSGQDPAHQIQGRPTLAGLWGRLTGRG